MSRLQPHESPKTDIILLGHSMGGLISAEVVLVPPLPPSEEPFRHLILGTINFDTPFLGMHPGVIVSGINSLFRPPPPMNAKLHAQAAAENKSLHSPVRSPLLTPIEPEGYVTAPQDRPGIPNPSGSGYFNQTPLARDSTSALLPAKNASASQLSLATPGETEAASDPNFNPPFPNDVVLSNRKGWANFFHFVNKHSDNLFKVTKEYVGSHMEFGGAMADYEGLKNRYNRIRALEDVDDFALLPTSEPGDPGKRLRRVRFVNYYTASTGRLHTPKGKSPVRGEELRPSLDGASGGAEGVENTRLSTDSSQISFSLQSEEGNARQLDVAEETQESSEIQDDIGRSQLDGLRPPSPDMVYLDPEPELDVDSVPVVVVSDQESIASNEDEDPHVSRKEIPKSTTPLVKEDDDNKLRAIPMIPTKPVPFDPSLYPNEVERKSAEKEHSRQMKVFEKALKERDNAIKERTKRREKQEKNARQAREKQVRQEEKLRIKEEKEETKKQAKQEKKEKKEAEKKKLTKPNPASIAMAAATSRHVGSMKDQDDAEPGGEPGKPKRDKKFCVLPHKDSDGKRPCWERIYMVGVDEVGAHCGLFFSNRPHYEQLVGDVGERIKEWVLHAASVREIKKLQSGLADDVD